MHPQIFPQCKCSCFHDGFGLPAAGGAAARSASRAACVMSDTNSTKDYLEGTVAPKTLEGAVIPTDMRFRDIDMRETRDEAPDTPLPAWATKVSADLKTYNDALKAQAAAEPAPADGGRG